MEWHEILSYVLGLAGALLGVAFFTRFQNVIKLLTEVGEMLTKAGEVFTQTAEALKDRKVTKAEAVLLLKAWQGVYDEFIDVYDVLKLLLPASFIKFLFRR